MSPARLLLAAGVIATLSALWSAISEPGPNAWLVLIRRYGIALTSTVVALAAGLLTLAIWPAQAAGAAIILAIGWFGASGFNPAWSPAAVLRRSILRARWVSVARSCNLAVVKDRRPVQWPAEVVMTGLSVNTIESLPEITRGRSIPGGLVYRLTPARGSTIAAVADQAEALAAGLRVGHVEVERIRPDLGRITFWLNREV